MPNFMALRAVVYPLFTKNLRGGGYLPPPVGARVNIIDKTKVPIAISTGFRKLELLVVWKQNHCLETQISDSEKILPSTISK